MAKKQKSKARLDKYYYLAKEHGFRSRAAFKLIQLNKKFNFLGSANCLIDLCAAPGGWLQVAAKYMPVSSIKIGVDLDPIKPINGVMNFQADITSEKCRFLIKKEIKHFKADVVLNDGAPNVGGQWSKDAYNQSELVLYALKLATEFLKEDGIFVTKIFRSSDYNSLLYVLKQLFKKVEATKPQASRSESAEIFVVCTGYRAPQYIDSKLLDPKYALKQLEDEEDMKMNSIKSIKSMFEKTKHRGGYSGKLYNEKSFKDFIESQNPYQFLVDANKIKPMTDDCKKYLEAMKCPMDYKLYFEDLQTLGKKEIQELIIWRNKIRAKTQKKDKADRAAENADADGEKEIELNYKEKKLEEIEEELNEFEKARKKRLEVEKKKRDKNELRMKMSFVNQQESAPQADEIEFDQNLFEFIKNNEINIEELAYKDMDKPMMIPQQTVDEVDLSDLSEDDFIDMMDEDIAENRRLFREKKSENHKKKEKREKKKKFERDNEDDEEKKKKHGDGIDYVKIENKDPDDEADQENEEGEEDENDSILGSDEDDDDENEEKDGEDLEFEEDSDEAFVKKQMKKGIKGTKGRKSFEEDDESENEEDLMDIDDGAEGKDKKEENNKISKQSEKKEAKEKTQDIFENPLRKKRNVQRMNKSKFNNENLEKQNKQKEEKNEALADPENNHSSDTDEDAKTRAAKKTKSLNKKPTEIKLLGKKTIRENSSATTSTLDKDTNLSDNTSNNKNKIDLAPKDSDSSKEDSEYDTDEKAEIRAIANKMLRKKDRLDILYKTYNRYAYDDLDIAPEWFREEEQKHNRPRMPVTKEEIMKQKEALRAFNSRMPKKVLEARARKKNKLTKKLDRVKQKAQAISNQDDISEFSKVKQMEKLYRKEIRQSKVKKKYVVARSNRRNMGKSGREVKFVDRRLKKDTKALKRAEKKNKKKGVTKPHGKGKKAGRR